METLDFRGPTQPDAVLLTRDKLNSMALGDRLQVLTVEQTSLNNIPVICMIDGHQLLSAEQAQDTILFEIEIGHS